MSVPIPESIGASLIVYGYTDETLIALRENAKDVRLAGLDDTEGLAKVRETRLQLKAVRVALEKRRVELKADALKYGQRVDAEAKRLVGMIEPQEKRLQEEEDSVAREAERQRALAEQKKREKAEKRLREIQAVTIPGDTPNMLSIVELSDERYAEILSALTNGKAAWDEEQRRERERLAAEAEAARKQLAEQERAQRAECDRLDRQREQQQLEQRELEEQKRALAAEQAALRRQKEEALPVPPAKECVRLCPTCGQAWNGGAP